MLLSVEEMEQRRKAILLLMARWAKNADTKQKALLVLEKNPAKGTIRKGEEVENDFS
jgi:hypothetical protein